MDALEASMEGVEASMEGSPPHEEAPSMDASPGVGHPWQTPLMMVFMDAPPPMGSSMEDACSCGGAPSMDMFAGGGASMADAFAGG